MANNHLIFFIASPRKKQSFWQDLHTPHKGKISPKKKFLALHDKDFLISAAFCSNFPDTFRIVTGSNRGNVAVWDGINGTVLFETGVRGHPAHCVMYCQSTNMVTITFTCDGAIFSYEVTNEQLSYLHNLLNVDECKSLFAIKENQFVVVSDRKITLWNHHRKFEVYQIPEEHKNNICSTVTSDQQYLVVSTNKETVYIYDIEKMKLIKEFENKG